MNEMMIKQAFRIAYDIVMKHQHPEFNVDYFMKVLDEFKEIRAANRDNLLLDCLLMGIYEYLAKEAKEEARK